jgi:FtsZ-binding cell division protein ZapB
MDIFKTREEEIKEEIETFRSLLIMEVKGLKKSQIERIVQIFSQFV